MKNYKIITMETIRWYNYAVAEFTFGYWQQVTKWYVRKGTAINRLNKLLTDGLR